MMLIAYRLLTTLSSRRLAAVVLVAAAMVLGTPDRRALSSCNVIPGVRNMFQGVRGTLDRPFASPGDWVDVSLDRDCPIAEPPMTFGPDPSDHAVVIVFMPPLPGPRSSIVIGDCARLALPQCAPPFGAGPCCQPMVSDPDPDPNVSLDTRDGATHLRFRFPDTDGWVRGADDDLTLTGPTSIAIGRVDLPGSELPLALADPGASCRDVSNVVACVDQLFAPDGTCTPSTVAETFGSFTALPPPNNYQALCDTPATPCLPTADEVHFTVDAAGNALVPVDWLGILVQLDQVPLARLLRGSTSVPAFEGNSAPIVLPSGVFLGSYSPEGSRLPPIFDVQLDPSPTTAPALTLFGTADAPRGVFRIDRHRGVCMGGPSDGAACATIVHCDGAPCVSACHGGGNAGDPCTDDGDCPGGVCGKLFEFADRLTDGVGPVAVEGPQFKASALDPVPLDGLSQSNELNAFVISEALVDRKLNGDSDKTDDVVELGDRPTGVMQLIGQPPAVGQPSSEGRAVVRIHEPPFSFPAVAVEDDVLAFIELEAAEGDVDSNEDGDTADGILRIYRLPAVEVSARITPPRVVDAAPLVAGRSLAVSNGRVFYRRPEAGQARQVTERVNLKSQRVGSSFSPAMSRDGRYVAFTGGDLLGPLLDFGIFVRDRLTGTNTLVSVPTDGSPPDGASDSSAISADGRYIAFMSLASNLVPNDTNNLCKFGDQLIHNCPDVFVRDRDTDGNGIFDEPGKVATTRVSVATGGAEANAISYNPSISADGRYVAFQSEANNLVPNDTNGGTDHETDIFVRDREMGTTTRVSVASDGAEATRSSRKPRSQNPRISADGRYVAFDSEASNLAPLDTNHEADVFVHDRQMHTTERVSVTADGGEGNSSSAFPSISADGRYVAFISWATNLVAGDTNGWLDVYVRDREKDITTRVSVSTGGQQADLGVELYCDISADGRYVTFNSGATNLVPNDTNATRDIFVHDRLTRTTTRVSISTAGTEAPSNSATQRSSISADGRYVAFESSASILGPGDPSECTGECIFVRGPDADDLNSDVFQDGELDDTVLESVDANTGEPTTLCPADEVAVAAGRAAFLRPESAVGTDTCPGGSLNGNVDLDVDDRVVQLWRGSGPVENLGVAATAIALSDTYLAALVSEAGQGNAHLNGDGDTDDNVVEVHPVGGGDWQNIGQAADVLGIEGSVVAFITSEKAEGKSLNGDQDTGDRVLQVYDAAASETPLLGPSTIPRTRAAEEFVLGGTPGRELIAFRTREAAEGNQSLNGDDDSDDGVLQVYDVEHRRRINTGAAVTPCRLEACDPRIPYRVGQNTVTFLTLEADQGGRDLNGDGDAKDLVLQVFNARQASQIAAVASAASTGRSEGRALEAVSLSPEAFQVLAAASAGVCTDTAEACAMDSNCPAGKCFVPPGGCVKDVEEGPQCDPHEEASCGPGRFCEPTTESPGVGICKMVVGPCDSDATCAALAACSNSGSPCVCNAAGQGFQRLVSPLVAPLGGGKVFTGAGRCIEDLGTSCSSVVPCASPASCSSGGTCQREHGTCKKNEDCPSGSTCRQDLVIATANDADGDEVADPFDNCPTVANPEQTDSDHDHLGDACDEGCPSVPRTGCRRSTESHKATLFLRNKRRNREDRLVWEWRRGKATTKSEFGDPLTTNAYTLCLYDGSGLITHPNAPAGGRCGAGRKCWKDGRNGFRYQDSELTPAGLSHVILTAGPDGKATIRVEGRGANLALPALASMTSPVTAQLINGHMCWEAIYSAPFRTYTPGVFRDTAD